MPKGHYVNNAMNRSLGRVGMDRGSAVHSTSGSSSGGGGGSSYSSGISSSTYVDNSMNRSLGRVGMEHGTAVHSRSGSSSGGRSYSSGVSSSTYVDNAMNRSLGRVGMEHGTAVHSRSGSSGSSSKTYVDNAYNQRLGRVGQELGTAVVSKSGSGSGLNAKFDQMALSSSKVYKDNSLNRKLNRVGKPFGTGSKSGEKRGTGKVYVDNAFNRKHDRVGKPLGTVPISRKDEKYRDTELNRQLGRVDKPWGTCPNPRRAKKDKITKLIDDLVAYLEQKQQQSYDFPFDDYSVDGEEVNEATDYAVNYTNRQRELSRWQEETGSTQPPRTDLEHVDVGRDYIINYDELEIGEQIGSGSFGDVFFARWRGTIVAVKKLHMQNVSRRRLEDFIKEVRLVSDLRHDNIVAFIGACVQTPNLCIVMEFMNMSLFDALHKQQMAFNDKEKIRMLRHACAGLTYLHEKRVAHCDIKSQNVLLDIPLEEEDKEKDYRMVTAKITDFGLSMMKAETGTSMSMQDATFRNRGTPRYSAPEVLRGEMLDSSQYMMADVYSVGLLMLELTVEEEPFYGLNELQLRRQVGEGGMLPAVPDDITLSGEFLDVLNRCWKFHPTARPSARELLGNMNELQRLIKVD
ncbi:serine/threonine-protein kinase STY8-like [Gigantopelta aegis]|uniref:serine/threonine-protein kinase STY8-like n=1 Tax=Gigantopelta aegis TaxID=1735272 RepID=UPI001B88C85D|nr:serine/threonine-protein kinase STY8-like [Gigantopelta aegis]